LKLDKDAARRNSPIHTLPAEEIPLLVAYGSEETAEFKRQSEAYGEAWSQAGFSCTVSELSGLNHFNLVAELLDSESFLTTQALAIMDAGS
jgi:arylformamidase